MKWFVDMAMLTGEWLILMLIALGLGIFIGWLLWHRKWQKTEVKNRLLNKELRLCRDEKNSLSVSRSEAIQELKDKLSECRDEKEVLKKERDQYLEEGKKNIDEVEDAKPLEASISENSSQEIGTFEEELAKASEGIVLDYEDDLKLIRGVGPKMEKMLKEFGVKTFYQLSKFDASGIQALNDRIDTFPGRVSRDNWVGQAKTLYKEHHE